MLQLASIILCATLLWLATDWYPRARLMKKSRSRKLLSLEAMYDEYFQDADKASVMSSLEFFQQNVDFPVGLLRPEDGMDTLNWGLPEGSLDYLYTATAALLSSVPTNTLESELANVETVRDYISTLSRLRRTGLNQSQHAGLTDDPRH